MFRAVYLQKTDAGTIADVRSLDESALPEGDVLVSVEYSTINYKDGLAITGRFPVVRTFPMVPGIDVAGTVESSASPRFKPGDKVLINGYGVGDFHWGGLAQKARVKSDWLIPVPKTFSTQNAMAIGTAGYTAMLCVLALEKHGVRPEQGSVLVTGAAGGVGSISIALLAKLGYTVAASTGRIEETGFLKNLGATQIIDRAMKHLARHGEIVLAGFYSEPLHFVFPPAFMREATLRIAAQWDQADLTAVLDLVSAGKLSLDGLVTHRSPAADAPSAYETAFTHPGCLKMVLDWRTYQ